jgi:hypothetical protein
MHVLPSDLSVDQWSNPIRTGTEVSKPKSV